VENSPFKLVKDMKALADVFYNTSVKIYESKKHALQGGNEELAAQGKDIISILSTPISFSSSRVLTKNWPVRENMKASDKEKLSDAELLGQIK
jgi:hypothetical protein